MMCLLAVLFEKVYPSKTQYIFCSPHKNDARFALLSAQQ